MSIQERIENNIVFWTFSMLLAGFMSGIAAYQAILKIAQLEVVSPSELASSTQVTLKNDKNYIEIDRIETYLEDQGRIILSKKEYDRLILSVPINGESQEIISFPSNDKSVKVKVGVKTPPASLKTLDQYLSLELVKVDKVRNRVKVEVFNKKSGKGKSFFLNSQDAYKCNLNNNKYRFTLHDIYEDEGALIGVAHY